MDGFGLRISEDYQMIIEWLLDLILNFKMRGSSLRGSRKKNGQRKLEDFTEIIIW